MHSTVPMDRCPAGGRQQPAVSHDVRIGICALFGETLDGGPVALVEPVRSEAEQVALEG